MNIVHVYWIGHLFKLKEIKGSAVIWCQGGVDLDKGRSALMTLMKSLYEKGICVSCILISIQKYRVW
jgi:hypothetical protein